VYEAFKTVEQLGTVSVNTEARSFEKLARPKLKALGMIEEPWNRTLAKFHSTLNHTTNLAPQMYV